jgi:hypothetical protein
MAMSNAERQRKWMEKNRALHNFRRRKKNLGGSKEAGSKETPAAVALHRRDAAQTISGLRKLIERVPAQVVQHEAKPTIFRDPFTGNVITERQWKGFEKRKEKAEAGGYEIDEWAQ